MHADIGHLEYYNRAINTVKRFLHRRSLRRFSPRIFPHVFAQKDTNTVVQTRAHLATNTRRRRVYRIRSGNVHGKWLRILAIDIFLRERKGARWNIKRSAAL